MTKHNLARLPNWARQEIERLSANEVYYKKELARAIGEEKSPIEVDPPFMLIRLTHTNAGTY